MKLLFILLIFYFLQCITFAQKVKVLESNEQFLKFSISFDGQYQIKDTTVNGINFQVIKTKQLILRKQGEPAIPFYNINLGIPHNSNLTFQIITDQKESIQGKFIIPFVDQDSVSADGQRIIFNKEIYNSNRFFPLNPVEIDKPFIFRFAEINNISVNPFQFNPFTKELLIHKYLVIKVNYNNVAGLKNSYQLIQDGLTEEYIRTNTINSSVAKNWITKEIKISLQKENKINEWYSPDKKYYKIYVKEKGIYRITYNQLRSAGLTSEEINSYKMELYNNGEKVPIEIYDGGDDLFNEDDYFQFVGYPPKPSPYCKTNIYNRSNVYWFSYEADNLGFKYKYRDGYPKTWDTTVQSSFQTNHYEVDSIYERLGLAPNGNRDHWFWGKASGQDGISSEVFVYPFPVPVGFDGFYKNYTLRVNLHGMTNNNLINPDHKVHIYLTSQYVGDAVWDGQNAAEFEYNLNINNVGLFNPNNFQIVVKGDISHDASGHASDEIRVNWFELDYLRDHRADTNYFNFISSPTLQGNIRFDVYNWKKNNMSIYVPQKGIVIKNPLITNDEYQEVLFTDSVNERTEYFCFANDYFNVPDSIVKNISSDLYSMSNGADYIIITHPKFRSAAEKLAAFRSEHLKGFSSPRVKIVDVNEIYNEFSYGLLDPYALKDFVKYAFENWSKPAPSYICLIGDMSWDYRQLLSTSRKNYIPSIPYHQITYGEAVSDNMIAAVSGDDVIPDLAIGRLSCETLDEANTLVDKIINYPADNSKEWKQNVLLIGAGESQNDESYFGFNSASKYLENVFLFPNGYPAKKVFRYPGSPEDEQYKGDRPEIRDAFNSGCAIANFYGHGGGYQWDFVFLNDDIYLLQNNNRLPVIFSVTCYTAHFDNQDAFGEQFNKVPGKGCIGFWGNTGLTVWTFGVELNDKLFDQIFNEQHYVIGDALLYSKTNYTNLSQYRKDHIALLTLLGDPALDLALPEKPDFSINPSSISISPEFPVINDTSLIKVKIQNLGRVFNNDSIIVNLTASFTDTTYRVGSKKLASFGEIDSVLFKWIPERSGSVTLKAEVNPDNIIDEMDITDNSASNTFVIFNLNGPNIIKPFNGFNTADHIIKFTFADIGYYISKQLAYYIEIDTSLYFSNPVIKSPSLSPGNGILEWSSPQLPNGIYFWRARMFDGQLYSKWTTVQTFSISDQPQEGYIVSGNQLKLFTKNNVIYSEKNNALQLNTSLLPPKPSNKKFISDIPVVLPDSISGLSAITTDGMFIYFGAMSYYNGTSKIYKLGTGFNNTQKGKFYGEVSDKEFKIWYQIFYHSDGYIYIPEGDSHRLTRLNPVTGDTSEIYIPSGLLNASDSKVKNGAFYLNSDGKYVYNLAYRDSMGNNKYTVRIFNPSENWKVIKDLQLTGESYIGFCSFFVARESIFPYENYESGYLRRINLNTGEFEDEWLSFLPFQGYYAWCYDWTDDVVYASVFRQGFKPKISEFAGTYKQANGSILSQEVGPAIQWNKLSYLLETTGSAGTYNSFLEGYNSKNKIWDTLYTSLPFYQNLESVDPEKYSKLRIGINLTDSSFGSSESIKFKSMNIQYTNLPEVSFSNNNLRFSPDSILQGFPIMMDFKVKNYGYSNAEDLKVNFYLDNADSSFYSKTISVPADSEKEMSDQIETNNIVLNHKIKVQGIFTRPDIFSFNNTTEKTFFIARDSIKPEFSIKFDGIEILNGDIVSSKPKVVMTLKDNSPLPLNDTSRFYIFHNNEQLSFKNDSLKFSYTNYPNSQATIEWDPYLKNGEHILEILAKDASGNFFDTTAYSILFEVNDKNDIKEVYNYPNPFKDDTYFTFILTGQDLPDELLIKIFTVAGRLIRDINVPVSELHFGLNKIYWNGRDQDENLLANGVYFYKIITRNKNSSKSVIQKLAKVK